MTEQEDRLQRVAALYGKEGLQRLGEARVLMFGLGGVGSWCAECLVRSGVSHLTLVDFDRVTASNCNRQLMATTQTIGTIKIKALRERLLEINPEAEIETRAERYTPETADTFAMESYDVIIDAIDDLPAKADLILRATALPKRIAFFSSMGAAFRRDPFAVQHAEFWNVKGDALARALRNRFKKLKVFPSRKFQCVFSVEPPIVPVPSEAPTEKGSLCHVTAIFGMSLAGLVLNEVTK